ncbi:ECF transporter S component [Microbacterium sp. 77mftsu3.1]|uniref:ECF transporter S component n=1 Tax=Microbacterium sp. 77mftsu3.1 TaxID=1761802 RepID=UPI0003627E88|nr:ECF transporter S component [Microbacterium sp. 77mftsu3.1]SDG53747.1 energy-coupling factor transport system substrate-specific component [Microbacterium sp. 77mftsu3.1]
MGKITTAYLLTCAAIGVASGIVLTVGWWVSLGLFATVPFASVAIAGLWVMPAVIALRLLNRPFAGLLVGVISGLVLTPFWTISAVATTVFWSLFPELPFLVTLYRRWSTWLHYAGGAAIGIGYPILAAQSFDLWSMSPLLVVLFIGLCAVSCVVGTWAGILIADRLRAAGVARLARRRAPRAS